MTDPPETPAEDGTAALRALLAANGERQAIDERLAGGSGALRDLVGANGERLSALAAGTDALRSRAEADAAARRSTET